MEAIVYTDYKFNEATCCLKEILDKHLRRIFLDDV